MMLILLTLIFITMRVIPGDPIKAMYGEKITEEFVLNMRKQLGLDKPMYLQYVDFMNGVFTGNLGKSFWTNRAVLEHISYAFPVTIELTIAGMALSILIGIPLGVVSALKKNKVPDYLIRVFSLAGFSMPVFFLGQILQYELGVQLQWFPIQGRYNPSLTPPLITHFITIDSLLTGNFNVFLDSLSHLLLPALVLASWISALISRISRANMLEVLNEDYILTARAKGLREIIVISKHAFRNAILPLFTIAGLCFALLLGGAVLTESVFSLEGMGKLLIDAVFRRDYPIIQGCVVVFALSVVVITTVVDIVYAFLDPRVKF